MTNDLPSATDAVIGAKTLMAAFFMHLHQCSMKNLAVTRRKTRSVGWFYG